MTSLREARYFPLLSYDQGLISDVEFILLYDSYKPHLPCDLYPTFELDEMGVRTRDIPLLANGTWHFEENMEFIYAHPLFFFFRLASNAFPDIGSVGRSVGLK